MNGNSFPSLPQQKNEMRYQKEIENSFSLDSKKIETFGLNNY